MNAAEQRTHRTVTQGLDARLDDLALVCEQLAENVAYLKGEIGRHASHLVLLDRLLEDKSAALAGTVTRLLETTEQLDLRSDACRQVLIRGFWGRLRWLLLPRGARPLGWDRTMS